MIRRNTPQGAKGRNTNLRVDRSDCFLADSPNIIAKFWTSK